MKAEKRLFLILVGMILAMLLFALTIDSMAQQKYVDDFYREAYVNGVSVQHHEFEFSIVPLMEAEGKATRRSDHWFIELDSYYWGSYGSKTQGKRLVFHELGHVVLGLPDDTSGNTIMNPAQLYKPLTDDLVVQMFQRVNGRNTPPN